MPEDYFGDGDSSSSVMPSSDDQKQPSEDGGNTAVVPAELCPGMKVGDKLPLTIVGVDENSYEVAYEPKGEESSENEAPAPAPDPMME